MRSDQIQNSTPGEEYLDDSKYSAKQKLDIQSFWAKLQLGDLCFLQIVDYGIALFGQTKAGKTTLAHLLVNNTLISKHNSRFDTIGYQVDDKSPRLTEAVIGLGSESETQIPNQCATQIIYQNKKVHLFDCPGYSDSKGSLMIVTNGYFHYRIFSKVKNLKFVLTFDGDQFRSGMAFEKAANTILEFFNSFKDIVKIKTEIFAATTFFFTKVQSQDIVQLLKSMRTAKFKSKGSLVVELIDNILSKQKYFVFKRPEKVGEKPKSQQFLKKIHQATSFWPRKVNQLYKEVDMSEIQISIGSKISLMQKADQSENSKFEILSTMFSNRFSEAMGARNQDPTIPSFKNILLQFLSNSMTGKSEQQSFYSLIVKFVKKFYIFDCLKEIPEYNKKEYGEKRNKIKKVILSFQNESIDKCQIEWIQKMEISKLIIEFLQTYNDLGQNNQKDYKSIQFFRTLSNRLMTIICQIKKIRFFKSNSVDKVTYTNDIQSFCYIIYRLIQEAKTFKIIFGSNSEQKKSQNQFIRRYDVTSTVFDTVTALIEQNASFKSADKNSFDIAKINYISSVLEIKQNESLYYYAQIQKYCKSIANHKKSEEYQKKLMEISTAKINSIKNQGNDNQKIASFITNIRLAISNLKSSNSSSNFEEYIGTMNQLGFFLSKPNQNLSTQEIKRAFKFAIKIYKYVNNVHRVVSTYRKLIDLYDQEKEQVVQLKQLLIQCAQYASSHGRRQLGLQMLEHAYHLIDRIPLKCYKTYESRRQQREKLGEMIGFMGLQRSYNPGQNYYDSLIMKRFCQIIEQSQLKQIQNKYPAFRR